MYRDPPELATRVITVDAAGSRLSVTRLGDGPAVVCLHAIGHGSRDYIRLAKRLADRFEFILLDWPAHGASAPGQVPVTAAHFAGVLAATLDQLGITRSTIIGNSIGGAAAIIYASRHPERVSGLVLCNPAGLQRMGIAARFICRRMAAFFAAGEHGHKGFPARFRRYHERSVLSAPAAAWRREEIIANVYKVAGVLRQAWESFAEPETDLRALPSSLQCPVLFAWAKGDRYVAWSRSKRAVLKTPHSTVRFFDGSHTAFLEQPELFEREFLSFMEENAVATPADSTELAECRQ